MIILSLSSPITQIQTIQLQKMGDSHHINGNTATYSTSSKILFKCVLFRHWKVDTYGLTKGDSDKMIAAVHAIF